VVDDRLIGAIHLRALTLAGLDHDPVEEHRAVQAGTIDALMAGDYDGDASLGELLRLGDTGIGTVQHLGGELIILDGVPWLIDADGAISELSLDVRTPFAVACLFRPETTLEITSTLDLALVQRTMLNSACRTGRRVTRSSRRAADVDMSRKPWAQTN
jgi:acetolactate decarboxylase